MYLSRSTHRARLRKPAAALVAVIAVVLLAVVVAPVPDSTAQAPSAGEQRQAAQQLMDQLNETPGPISMGDLTIDPALGPPPWLSYMPERDPSTIAAWVALAQRQGQTKATPNALDNARALDIGIVDIESAQEIGLNDTIATGQIVPGFNARTNPRANISGGLGAVPPPPVCPSAEDDGSIPLANEVGLPPQAIERCEGTIGDGPFATTSGDVDFFEIGYVPEGDGVLVDAFPALPGPYSAEIAIYTSFGELVGSAEDLGPEFLIVPAPSDGVYYAAVAGVGGLPANPFDSSSGPGVTTTGDYVVFVGSLGPPPPPPPPPCSSLEDDGAIQNAVPTGLEVVSIATLCEGAIGDGPFGTTSGDFDFYQVTANESDVVLFMDIASRPDAQPASVTVYDSAGFLLGTAIGQPGQIGIDVQLPGPGDYYAMVSAPEQLPNDPFDSSSGNGATDNFVYGVTIGTYTGVLVPPPIGPTPTPSPTATPVAPGGPTPTPTATATPPAGPTPAPPPIAITCQSSEDDGSFDQANDSNPVDGRAACLGRIGDGPWAQSSGDFDFYTISAGDAQQQLEVQFAGAPIGLAVSLYDSVGEIVIDQMPMEPLGLTLNIPVGPGTFYMMVGETGYAPSDPFNPGNGPGPNTVEGEYLATIVLTPLGPPELFAAEPARVPQRPAALQAEVNAMTDARNQALAAYEENRDMVAERDALVEAAEPDMVIAACESIEDDGSIPTASPTFSNVDIGAVCVGTIGDGPQADTSGDFDIFLVDATAGDVLIAEIEAERIESSLDSFLWILDPNGNIIATNDDSVGLDSLARVRIQNGGPYYVVVGAFATQLIDPFDPTSGTGGASTGDYRLTISQGADRPEAVPDVDVYLVDLEPGDAFRAGFNILGASATIVDPAGVVRQSSTQSVSFIYPLESPLRHLGNIGVDHVAAIGGQHAVIITGGVGPYTGEFRVIRPGRAEAPGSDTQIIYLDFDGASVDPTIWDPFLAPGERDLSPLSAFLERWNLTAADEDAVIDSILASFNENIDADLRITGGNGDRDATGNPGEFDIEVRNSRDDPDPWGEPNVSRIIVGGSIAEFGIPTIGIAQTIDPGNADPTETAVVLLDVLSEAPGVFQSSLNNFQIGAPLSKVDLVGQGVGIIAAHEAGHFVGNWHLDGTNTIYGIMDPGGNLAATIGLGPDLTLGTPDDEDVDFDEQAYSPAEGFGGFEDTATRSGFAMTTGQAPVINEPELPDPGVYYLQNVGTGRWLDADRGQNADTSSSPSDDDRWELSEAPGGWYLRNLTFNEWLDTDGSTGVDLSTSPSTDDVWFLEPLDNGAYLVTAVQRGANLTVVGTNVNRSPSTGANSQWLFTPLGDPPPPPPPPPPPGPPGDFIGAAIVLVNQATQRWLDGDVGNVDQSQTQQADDVWFVTDAGDGAVLLQNQVTGRYLDADGSGSGWNVDSSANPASDDRWEIVETPDGFGVRNVQYGRWLTAETGGSFNVVTGADLAPAAIWQISELGGAGIG